MKNKEIFAENLRRYMCERKVTAKELSAALDFPYTTLLSWLNADNYPRIDKIEAIADYFGIQKSDLIEDMSHECTEGVRIAFADNLKKYMQRSGASQKDLAIIAGVSTATVSDWVAAKKYPRIEKIDVIAEYFGIRKSDLIEESAADEKKSNEPFDRIIAKMKTDDVFRSVVVSIYKLDASQLNGVNEMLRAFTQ